MIRIESLLSARLFLSPQRDRERLYFISNLSSQMSLYAMDTGGSVPEPLLPSNIALQNPILLGGLPFSVFPNLGKIMVMIDSDGDENYQPMLIPQDGGIPVPAFSELFKNYRSHLMEAYPENSTALIKSESRDSDAIEVFLVDLNNEKVDKLYGSPWINHGQLNLQQDKAIFIERYGFGDHAVYLWEKETQEVQLMYGIPLSERSEGHLTEINGIAEGHFVNGDKGLIFITSLFDDLFGIGILYLDKPGKIEPVEIRGLLHSGQRAGERLGEMPSERLGEMPSELSHLAHLSGDRFLLTYNVDGTSWAYEAILEEEGSRMTIENLVVGQGKLSDGYLQSIRHDHEGDSYALSFSTATSPSQLFTVGDQRRETVIVHTRERILGIPEEHLSTGEAFSFSSFDGTRTFARLYLPAENLGFQAPFPLIYYVHGGPHSQERPDFTWFSIPLIQFLTLHGFTVFVPNVRGSTGYGMAYTKLVDRDWGGDDRLDHAHAIKVLGDDQRIDTSRVGLVGRSYGGYMSLILAGRHPELWSAAVDMFGPYDLLTFLERIPPTWKAYYKIALGDLESEKDRQFLRERSPRTHLHQLACPLLVIQGKNDPRVVERESSDLVEALRSQGKQIDYLLFENEGHDVLKFENRVRCYNGIKDFFIKHVM
jgi:pimeloyl-ACP methyl ester carboxylesterase